MTGPHILRHNLNKIMNRVEFLRSRLTHAVDNLTRNTPDGYPTKASGTWTDGGRPTATLTPTEADAHTRLGDLWGIGCDGDPCTEPTHWDPETGKHDPHYRPGPVTQLDDLNDHLEAALTSLAAFDELLTRAGTLPLHTPQLLCINYTRTGGNCDHWKDQTRTDGYCIDCGRTADSNARRKNRYSQ